ASSASSKTWIVWSLVRVLLTRFTLDSLMIGVMLVVIFAAAACTSMQSDSWWQLRSGEWIIRLGRSG
ncbi:MAG: hypothetical protein ACJ8CR_10835, partial [Roseiflexaceae bacterium]